MGVEGELSRRVPPDTMETLLQSDALQSDPALAVEQALQAGSFMLPGQVTLLPDTVEREQIAFEEFKQGGMAFDTRNTLAANPPANLTPYPAEPVPPTVPATAACTVMPLPLAASGPVGAVMPYDPTIPEPAPLAAPTLVNRKKANDAAWKAAEAERKRLARLDKKKRAREAAGLPAVEPPVVLTAQQLKSKHLRKERNGRRQKLKNTQAAHDLDVDSDE